MTERPPPYERYIRLKRSCPSACPVCGKSILEPKDCSFKELLGSYLQSPSRLELRDVPGWKGFKAWWFVCLHTDPIHLELEKPSYLLSKLPKSDAWTGGTFRLPLSRAI